MVLFFLKDRTRLIRQYFEQAAGPFDEIIRKIEAQEEPYVPAYSEDGEPPFLSKWTDVAELREVTGRCCSRHRYSSTSRPGSASCA